jgi:diadenosine tetraphosphate (Ap4A) HIT family hydrolase
MVSSNLSPDGGQCEFCSEFAAGTANSFAARYGDQLHDRTILDDGQFRIMPSLGQIVPGYLLVVPTRHYCAFADMSVEELTTAEALKTHLSGQLRSAYGDCLFFEHGARTSESGGCGISHAHLHAVPFPKEKDPAKKITQAFAFEEISSLVELKRIQPERSYLYYEAVRGKRYVLYPPFIPSQYIRRLLAEALGTKEWDWRQCGKEERFLTTLARTSQLLAAAPR